MAYTNTNIWRCGLKINSHHALSQVVAVADKVAKVLSSNFCVALELARFFSLELKLFDVSLKANADVVRWTLERAADLGANAQRVCMRVVDGCQLSRQLCTKSMGQGLRH